MIPDIESIVESLLAGECTKEEALRWIGMHMEMVKNSAESHARLLINNQGALQ